VIFLWHEKDEVFILGDEIIAYTIHTLIRNCTYLCTLYISAPLAHLVPVFFVSLLQSSSHTMLFLS
jgi:hypothetical protein